MSKVKIYVIGAIGETVELQPQTVNYGILDHRSEIWLVMLLLWETGDSRRERSVSQLMWPKIRMGKCDVRLFLDSL